MSRAVMRIGRGDSGRSKNFLRSIDEASRQQRYLHDLGINALRVTTVTTTPERVEQMLEALTNITDGRGSSMFLFATERTFAASNPLDVEWVSGKGELVRITD